MFHVEQEEPPSGISQTKIIAASGGGFGGTMNLLSAAKLMGVFAALRKPFSIKEAVATVERALQPLQ